MKPMPVAEINGAKIHYHVKGNGLPIVFIHPPVVTSANFQYQSAQLSDGCKVILFDIRGHGMSEASEAPLTYSLIAEDIKQLLDFLGEERAYVCGYSTGGSIALEFMLKYPQRCLGGILISGMSEMSDWLNRSRIQLGMAACTARANRALARAIALGNADNSVTYANLFRTAVRGNIRKWREYYRYSLIYNCTSRLRMVSHPVMLIYGKKDRFFHKYESILRERLQKPQTFWLDGFTHQLPTKAALQVNERIRKWIGEQQTENADPIPPTETDVHAGAFEAREDEQPRL
ncbi:alpha/beta fold hydrolase [Ferviditalea candida]